MENNPQNELNSFPIELNNYTYTMLANEFLSSGYTLEQMKLYVKYPMTYNKQLRKEADA